MKAILFAMGIFMSLQVFAQTPIMYSYDSAGNRTGREPVRNYSLQEAPSASIESEELPALLLMTNPTKSSLLAHAASQSEDYWSLSRFLWDNQYCFFDPAVKKQNYAEGDGAELKRNGTNNNDSKQ